MQRKKYDPNLPKNLTYRRRDKAYYWRNPLTKEEFTLGKISRRDAVAQAIEANHYIYKNYSPAALIEKLKGFDSFTMADWIERYKTILIRRKVSRNTYKIRVNQLETIKEKLGGVLLTEITTRHIAEFLDLWIEGGKNTMAGSMRSVLSDMFREAIVEGRISQNPVTPTRAPKIVVTRERLKLKTYNCIREAADQLPTWFPLAMDLALVTGQRREDITNMRFSEIYDDRLHIRQIKTGMMIAIPLSLSLPVADLRLGTVVEQCRMVSRGDYLISAGIRKNSPDGSIHPDGLTKKFVAARKLTGIQFSENPPTFHEIRSLAGRLYKETCGEEFAQRLLGHTSEKTTKMYLDEREKTYLLL